MKHTFRNKRIASIVTIMPPKEVFFKDEMQNFSFTESQNLRLARVMGFNKRRICQPGDTISDYATCGIRELLSKGALDVKDVGAIVVVTTTPDHFIPAISNIVQGQFDFSTDTICMDISQGCSGYVVGLQQAFMLLDIMENDKKVLLITGDFLSQRVAVRDRGSRPITGDAVSVSVIENGGKSNVYLYIKNDGANCFAVYIPAGGNRMPSAPETAIEEIDMYGNYRSKNQLVMNGDLVFNFIINEVPSMMEDLLQYAEISKDEIEYFMCHQSSKFTLQKLADRLEISQKRLPYNVIENFGNSSSASIPVAITFNLSDLLTDGQTHKIMITGFGIGLTWGSIILDMGDMKFCEMINYGGYKIEIPVIE